MKLNSTNRLKQKRNELKNTINTLMNSKVVREKMIRNLELSIVRVV